jgi:hypothetical protein
LAEQLSTSPGNNYGLSHDPVVSRNTAGGIVTNNWHENREYLFRIFRGKRNEILPQKVQASFGVQRASYSMCIGRSLPRIKAGKA